MKLVKINAKDNLNFFNVIVVPVQRPASWHWHKNIDEFIDAHIGDNNCGEIEKFKFQRDASGVVSTDSDYGLMSLEEAFEDGVLNDDEKFTKGLDVALGKTDLSYGVKSRDWSGITWDFFSDKDKANDHHQQTMYQAATSDFNVNYVLEDVGDVISLFRKRFAMAPHLSRIDSECAKIIADHYSISDNLAYYLLERATRTAEKSSSQTSYSAWSGDTWEIRSNPRIRSLRVGPSLPPG